MINVKSKEEAVEWASRCPASDNEIIEIRQVQEVEELHEELKNADGFTRKEKPGKIASGGLADPNFRRWKTSLKNITTNHNRNYQEDTTL